MARLSARLDQVGHVVAVMSGKGGVGKSTLTTVLAEALHLMGYRVGVIDADIGGPSIAFMTGVRDQSPSPGSEGILPAETELGVKVMSIDLFLPRDSTAVLWKATTRHNSYMWRPMVEMGALRELIADTAWGSLDVLLVDLPPGSDRLPSLKDLLTSHLSGAIVVTGPTGISQLVVSRSIMAANQIKDLPIIGLVENMSAYICGACGQRERLNDRDEHVEAVAFAHGIPFLGRVPFDPYLARATDRGKAYLPSGDSSPAKRAIMEVGKELQKFLFN